MITQPSAMNDPLSSRGGNEDRNTFVIQDENYGEKQINIAKTMHRLQMLQSN